MKMTTGFEVDLKMLGCVEVTLVRAGLFALTVWALCTWRQKPGGKLPPSPFQFPLIGCLPFLEPLVHKTMSKWAKKFGKIYSCRLGGKLVVLLNDARLIREAFARPEFNGRPYMYTASVTSKGYGISFASDDTWSMHRRFAFKTFRQLGVGNGKVEEKVAEAADGLIGSIGALEGKPFENKLLLQATVANVIGSVLFGQQFDPEDPKTVDFNAKINAVFGFFGELGALNIFPVLRLIPSIGKSFQKVIDALDSGASFIAGVIKQHEGSDSTSVHGGTDYTDSTDSTGVHGGTDSTDSTGVHNGTDYTDSTGVHGGTDYTDSTGVHNYTDYTDSGVHDYTDAFIKVRNEEKRTYGQPKFFTDQQFVGAARELFMTGCDTTTSTLRWAFLHLLKYPEIQRRIQTEMDNVIGQSRSSTYSDLKKLPYLQAFLFESARISSIAPLGIPHRATEDAELAGYYIPKDTWIMANFWHVHHDENIWADPDTFRPERFLSADEKQVITPKHFIPFSIGKRSCPGESLAKMEIFLIFSRILQQFDLSADETCDLNLLNHNNAVNGFSLDPGHHRMIATAR